MKQEKLILLILPLFLGAESYEDKVYINKNHHPSNIGIHTDLGYSSYMIELHSSEINSAIDYDILEFTLGASYSYDSWMWGVYGKFVVDELKSNMYIGATNQELGNSATINKDEFGIYTNYTISQSEQSAWRVNAVYRYSSLDSTDSYLSYHQYSSRFKYQTYGLALSLVYSRELNKKSSIFLNAGVSYSLADIEVAQTIDGVFQDSFVDDSSSTVGTKLSLGYSYRLLNNLFFNLRVDGWYSDFKKIAVDSRVGDSLPSATLEEQSYTAYSGITWSF